jgi:hypothetical protein
MRIRVPVTLRAGRIKYDQSFVSLDCKIATTTKEARNRKRSIIKRLNLLVHLTTLFPHKSQGSPTYLLPRKKWLKKESKTRLAPVHITGQPIPKMNS